jgi:undecaprenyl pyrophosphate synthase
MISFNASSKKHVLREYRNGVHVALNYGGRAEIVDAVNRLMEFAGRNKELGDGSGFRKNLYTAGLPDPIC